jgi:LmbE family N-acetylglucosaminyl deacetylase
MNTLLLLAHHDDEYFVSARIRREIRAGNRVLVMYTTWGSAYGTSGEARASESLRALGMAGVTGHDVVMLGRDLGVDDGDAGANCLRILAGCRDALRDVTIHRLISPAWEGGHPDHDITHLVARRLAEEWQIRDELYEFPLYTAEGAPRPLFRVNRFGRRAGQTIHTSLGLRERIWALLLARCYRSQWRSFVGLLPESTIRYLVQGEQQLRRVAQGVSDGGLRIERPHAGELFYERRFGTRFEDLVAEAMPLLQT